MGMFLKSAIGLGSVYFAMFAPAIWSADIGPAANLCASAARARLEGDATLHAQWSAAGCAVKLAAVSAPPSKPAPPPPPPKPALPPPKAVSGTLSEADLAEPWFGPTRASRKSGARG